MKDVIIDKLKEIEVEHKIQIIYAVESGSRAWGFASPDSDYDVRFIYMRPIQDYLSLYTYPDTITMPIGEDLLDFHGWDLFKASHLLAKSNTSLLEWLGSPIIYIEKGSLIREWRGWVQKYISLKKVGYHHLNTAKRVDLQFVQDQEQVKLKKYLYLFRSLIALFWLEQKKTNPPTSIWETIEQIILPPFLQQRLHQLLEWKQEASETDLVDRDEELNQVIIQELERLTHDISQWEDQQIPYDQLNKLIWKELMIACDPS